MVAVHGWSKRDKLIHACRAIFHVFSQPFEVFQGSIDACGQGDPFAFDVAKGFLHLAKQTPVLGEGECHRAQFAKDKVPLVHTYPVLGVRYGGDDFLVLCRTVGREGDHHVDGVNNRTEHGLACGP